MREYMSVCDVGAFDLSSNDHGFFSVWDDITKVNNSLLLFVIKITKVKIKMEIHSH